MIEHTVPGDLPADYDPSEDLANIAESLESVDAGLDDAVDRIRAFLDFLGSKPSGSGLARMDLGAIEGNPDPCPNCLGTGRVESTGRCTLCLGSGRRQIG